jgi:hypothetical protein
LLTVGDPIFNEAVPLADTVGGEFVTDRTEDLVAVDEFVCITELLSEMLPRERETLSDSLAERTSDAVLLNEPSEGEATAVVVCLPDHHVADPDFPAGLALDVDEMDVEGDLEEVKASAVRERVAVGFDGEAVFHEAVGTSVHEGLALRVRVGGTVRDTLFTTGREGEALIDIEGEKDVTNDDKLRTLGDRERGERDSVNLMLKRDAERDCDTESDAVHDPECLLNVVVCESDDTEDESESVPDREYLLNVMVCEPDESVAEKDPEALGHDDDTETEFEDNDAVREPVSVTIESVDETVL